MSSSTNSPAPISRVIGRIPYRLALAGGWIDQPFVSRLNPAPPGSMVVVSVRPNFRFMERSGVANGTRDIATKLWRGRLPQRDPAALVRELYATENRGKKNPSGSQDMIGLVYPGINRLDYDASAHGGVFPAHIESLQDHRAARWLERVLHLLPVCPRPAGYDPLGKRNLDPRWIVRLGRTGRECFEAIRTRDLDRLGASFNECMKCWETLLPATVRHHTLTCDLPALLRVYQSSYPGAMYSGCGGGYLFVVSEKPVAGAFQIQVRVGAK
ncbi:MAG: hypothetical protein EPO07_11360 [Verrucomicrobia bacterium]|nr:MAG: hypothetical protein EPO07_11360 [Verrucomicrobiota bacterium]